jgi:hypothetical protein
MRLLFFCFLFTLNLTAQNVLISDHGRQVKNIVLDSLNNRLLVFYQDKYDAVDLNTFEKKSSKLVLNDKLDLENSIMIIGPKIYFVSRDGGMVYEFKNDTIKRIDRSFNHKMQSGAKLFKYQSKIFKYGGYGFWSVRNFFTYYDKTAREWEVVSPINSSVIPEGTFSGFYIRSGENIYLFGGYKIDPFNQLKKIPNNEVWKFNFNSHKWVFLGIDSYEEKGIKINYRDKLILVNDYGTVVIDVLNNKRTIYRKTAVSELYSTPFPSFFLNNKFYNIRYYGDESYLNVTDEKEFFGKKIAETKFYKNYLVWSTKTIIYIFLFGLFLFIINRFLKFYKKSKKIILLENGLRYRNKVTEFDLVSMQIIKKLLAENEIHSNVILKIIEQKQYSTAHNERIKVQKINEINLKIKTLLGIKEDIINSIKSKSDKRIRIYKMSKKYFNKRFN